FISEGKISIAHPGFFLRIARTVSANTAAPPSFKSSRATAVTTACLSPIMATESATLSGSPQSSSFGSPVLTAQNRHPRVHVSPKIINVAVFRSLQHSCILGHLASSQTVFNPFSRISFLSLVYDLFVFNFIFSQSGLRKISFCFCIKVTPLEICIFKQTLQTDICLLLSHKPHTIVP